MSVRPAAVIVPIYRAPRNSILFVRRASHLRRQPNHIAFPGGVVDEGDGDDRLATALRELREELGVAADRVTVITRLPDRSALGVEFMLTPFVGILEADEPLAPDPSEVGEIIEVPLDAVFAPGAIHKGETDLGDRIVTSWHFDFATMHVWGVTGRILHTLVEMVRENADGLRDVLQAAGVTLSLPATGVARRVGP
ncbi:MAG TPA: CoA pyrophosphatase [Candidatus Binatia bacterium]|nr:CoA pyrophosphatase [Candidatus Binatia bacterium]